MDLACNMFILSILVSLVASQELCPENSKCIPIYKCPGLINVEQRDFQPLTKKNIECLRKDDETYICCPLSFMEELSQLLPNTSVCGISQNDRIIGGNDTDIDEYPWLALIRYDKPLGWGFYCGGTLISWDFVLTAAHCLKGAAIPLTWNITQVRLGEWDITKQIDCLHGYCNHPALNVDVLEQIAHENYNPNDSHQQHDIALLKLARKVVFTDFIAPICLPLTQRDRNNLYIGHDMDVAGWGKTETSAMSAIKLKVSLPIVSLTDCANVYKRAKRNITDKQLCAGGQRGKDSCRGDSGGPLMTQMPRSQNWVIAGVVSYGPTPCGTPGWPGVYTRVGQYIDWIETIFRSHY